jgi:hypothetical protein
MCLFVRTKYGALHIEEHYSAAAIGSSRPNDSLLVAIVWTKGP